MTRIGFFNSFVIIIIIINFKYVIIKLKSY